MPIAKVLSIDDKNLLIIQFDQSMKKIEVSSNDLKIEVFKNISQSILKYEVEFLWDDPYNLYVYCIDSDSLEGY